MSKYYITTKEGILDCYNYIINRPAASVDTETTGFDPHSCKLLSIQIGDQYNQYVIDYLRTKPFLDPIKEILASNKIVKVYQNSKFDLKFLKKNLNVRSINNRDTMLAEQILAAGKRKSGFSLKDLAKKYLGIDLDKEIRNTFDASCYGSLFTEDQITYAAKDVEVPIPIYEKQRALLSKYSLFDVFLLECEAAWPIAIMELNGFYLDKDKWTKLYNEAMLGQNDATKDLDDLFRPFCNVDLFNKPSINYNSPLQLAPKILEITGIFLNSTGVEELKKHEKDHDLFKLLLEYRAYMKRCTTYGISFLENINPITGRIHPRQNQLGADSGRMSQTDPNLQQIPSLIIKRPDGTKYAPYREAFASQNDGYIITADYSGCELRILAELSGDPVFQQIFFKDLDAHKFVSSMILNIPYDQVTDEMRKPGKAINFGTIYGIGPKKLANNLKIDIDTAKLYLAKFFKSFVGVDRFLRRVEDYARTNKRAVSPFDGRLRDLSAFDWDDPKDVAHALNIAKNMPFQAGNASMTKKALVICQNKIEALNTNDVKLVNVIHDEIVTETDGDKEKALAVEEIIKSSMIEAGQYYMKTIPIKVDTDVEKSWVK